MQNTLFADFKKPTDARLAVAALLENGLSSNDLCVLRNLGNPEGSAVSAYLQTHGMPPEIASSYGEVVWDAGVVIEIAVSDGGLDRGLIEEILLECHACEVSSIWL